MLLVGFTVSGSSGIAAMSAVWLAVPPVLLVWQAHHLRRLWNIGARDLIGAVRGPIVAVALLAATLEVGGLLIGNGNPRFSSA